MVLTASLLLDLAILALLLYSVVMGFRRGLILTLCSLLAVVLAVAGGWYLATHHSASLEVYFQPMIEEKMQDGLGDRLQDGQSDASSLFPFSQELQEKAKESAQSVQNAAIAQWSADIAVLIARSILFLVGFLVVLLVWEILCHALHLAAKLPGLHILNKIFGGVAGFIKGIILLVIARWVLCDLLGWIPNEVISKSYLLPLLSSFSVSSLFLG